MSRHVYLVGFMGSGKSTVGPLLARHLDRHFYDLDELIEKNQHLKISDIFESRGELYFREVESQILAHTKDFAPAVIALGGGTFVRESNRHLVAANGIAVWLKVPLRLARERCSTVTNRPLARDPEEFQALFHSRVPFYELSDIHVPVEGKSPEQICAEVHQKLKGRIQ